MTKGIVLFKIDGPAIKETYPLHEINFILNDFHSIIDQSYLVLVGKNRLSRSERLQYRILASLPTTGSYFQKLEIVYELAAPLLPLVPQFAGSDIWKSAKASFEFLKTVAKLRRNGQEPTIKADNNKGIIVCSAPGTQPVTVNQNIFNIATHSEDFYKRITSSIATGHIDTISAIDDQKQGILLTVEEKELFNPETKLEENPIDVLGNIFDFNKDKLTGKFRVSGDQPIPQRDYNFHLIDDKNFVSYILAMTKNFVVMRCLPEIVIHATGGHEIYKLRAISIKDAAGPAQ